MRYRVASSAVVPLGATAILVALSASATSLGAQEATPPDSVLVVPDSTLKSNSFFELFWGHGHRRAWTAEFPVPLLNLSTYSGGLEAERQITGDSHKALILRDPDGRLFMFRSVSRDLSLSLPQVLKGRFIELIVQELSLIHI